MQARVALGAEAPRGLVSSARRTRWLAEFGVLAGFVVFTFAAEARFVVHGQPWVDAAMFFHFGRRFLTTGAVPFRDYVFQVGPLPVYVDALFQALFGDTFRSSLWAALTLKAALAFVVHLFAKRWVNRAAGILLGVFLVLDPVFCFQHHWSTPYALLFGLLAILFFVRAHERPSTKLASLAASGAFAACIVAARQSGAIAVGGALLIVTLALAWRARDLVDARALRWFWGGYAAALGAFGALLVAQGALAITVRGLLLDAPDKKSVLNVDVLLDVFSGGGLVERSAPWTPVWGFLHYNAVPLVLVALILGGLSRRPREKTGAVLLAILPVGVALARVSSTWQIGALDDLPRVFALVTLPIVLLAPGRAARMLGMPASTAAMVLAVPLALEMALEASHYGRGWVDASSMMAMCILLGLRTTKISRASKTVACAAFALVGVVNATWLAHRGYDPFAKDDMFEGTLAETTFATPVPAARGMYTDEAKYRVVEWLRDRVRPGDDCFVYGSSAMLYDLLDCKNPTRIDITISEFFSKDDGERAVDDLRRAPPEWIVAAETHWTNPDLAMTYTGDDSIYASGPNGAAAKVLHLGVKSLLDRYELIGETSEALPSELVPQAERHPEKPNRYRLYRRRSR